MFLLILFLFYRLSNVANEKKTNRMNSTLKITFNRDYEKCPVIKIVMPLSIFEEIDNPAANVDEKDVLIRDFLMQPGYSRRVNQFYKIDCNFTAPEDNSTHQVSTIRPIQESEQFDIFKTAILNMLPNPLNEDLITLYPDVFKYFDVIMCIINSGTTSAIE